MNHNPQTKKMCIVVLKKNVNNKLILNLFPFLKSDVMYTLMKCSDRVPGRTLSKALHPYSEQGTAIFPDSTII